MRKDRTLSKKAILYSPITDIQTTRKTGRQTRYEYKTTYNWWGEGGGRADARELVAVRQSHEKSIMRKMVTRDNHSEIKRGSFTYLWNVKHRCRRLPEGTRTRPWRSASIRANSYELRRSNEIIRETEHRRTAPTRRKYEMVCVRLNVEWNAIGEIRYYETGSKMIRSHLSTI